MSRLAVSLLCAALCGVPAARAASPPDPAPAEFQRGLMLDIGHGARPDPVAAFRAYLRAAELGLPQAEFNVAVMYDSGRGVAPDPARAARWYAAAASGGLRRAAYNLAQMYEQGDGVARDPQASRAWFHRAAGEGLTAARPHLRDRALKQASEATAMPGAALPISPSESDIVALSVRPPTFIWQPPSGGGAVSYVVQVTATDASPPGLVFTGDTDVTAIAGDAPLKQGHYAWRVFAVREKSARVTQSGWTRFSVSDFMPSR
jgi:hypothetical protein